MGTQTTRRKKYTKPLRKVTVLNGYYATGDGDGFCFDRCRNPHAHAHRWRRNLADAAAISWRGGSEAKSTATACLVYPEALLPTPGVGQRGCWRIIVEFQPSQRRHRRR